MKLTPRMDAWIAALAAATAPHGAKADLARFLAANPGPYEDKPLLTVQNNIARWLRRQQNPNGETVLAVSDWLASRPIRGRRKRGRS